MLAQTVSSLTWFQLGGFIFRHMYSLLGTFFDKKVCNGFRV